MSKEERLLVEAMKVEILRLLHESSNGKMSRQELDLRLGEAFNPLNQLALTIVGVA